MSERWTLYAAPEDRPRDEAQLKPVNPATLKPGTYWVALDLAFETPTTAEEDKEEEDGLLS